MAGGPPLHGRRPRHIPVRIEAARGGGKSTAPRVARIPPPFQAVPVRPIVMDEAGKFIHFPSLQGKTVPAPKATNRWGLGSFFTSK